MLILCFTTYVDSENLMNGFKNFLGIARRFGHNPKVAEAGCGPS